MAIYEHCGNNTDSIPEEIKRYLVGDISEYRIVRDYQRTGSIDSDTFLVALSAAMMVTSKGKSLFKDPDTLETVKQGYTRILKGKTHEMPDIPLKEVKYTKRSASETKKLHSQSTAVKKKFREDLAKSPEVVKQMKKNGISDKEIKDMSERGLSPKGYEVHHKLPLDDGGTNDPSNLILTKKSPYHSAFTAEQKTLTSHLKEGETKIINFPLPKGKIYPLD